MKRLLVAAACLMALGSQAMAWHPLPIEQDPFHAAPQRGDDNPSVAAAKPSAGLHLWQRVTRDTVACYHHTACMEIPRGSPVIVLEDHRVSIPVYQKGVAVLQGVYLAIGVGREMQMPANDLSGTQITCTQSHVQLHYDIKCDDEDSVYTLSPR